MFIINWLLLWHVKSYNDRSFVNLYKVNGCNAHLKTMSISFITHFLSRFMQWWIGEESYEKGLLGHRLKGVFQWWSLLSTIKRGERKMITNKILILGTWETVRRRKNKNSNHQELGLMSSLIETGRIFDILRGWLRSWVLDFTGSLSGVIRCNFFFTKSTLILDFLSILGNRVRINTRKPV